MRPKAADGGAKGPAAKMLKPDGEGAKRPGRVSAAAAPTVRPYLGPPSRRPRSWGLALAVLASAIVLGFQFTQMNAAGGLWRDEVNGVNIATAPSLGEMWRDMQYDSAPALWFLLVRGWCAMGQGTDSGLRLLGFITAMACLASLWYAARRLGIRWPLICLAMFSMNPDVVRRVASMRAYGLGVALILLALATMWDAVQSPSRRRVMMAGLAAVLSVQTLYYNAILIMGICAAAGAVAVGKRAWRRLWIPAGVGGLAAISMLPYLDIMRRMSKWFPMLQTADSSLMRASVLAALGAPGEFMVYVWLFLGVMALAAGGLTLAGRLPGMIQPRQKELTAYAVIAAVVGSAAYYLLLANSGVYPRPWFYLAWMAVAALCADAVAGAWAFHWGGNAFRAACLLGVVAATMVPAWGDVRASQTNVDLIAAKLSTGASSDDLIIVTPWFVGISFDRYYHGRAKWMTIPDVPDHTMHRYDQVLRAIQTPGVLQPMLEAASRTLHNGGTVWVVSYGGLPISGGRVPPPPLPATDDPATWRDSYYYGFGELQLGSLISHEATRRAFFHLRPPQQAVNRYEDCLLYQASR